MPEVVPELSTRRLLTMNWLEGKPLLSFKTGGQEERNRLALNMFRAWYVPFYGYGVIHGDPHLGNYTVRDDLDINLLDFGCIRIFRAALRQGRDRPLLGAGPRRPRSRRRTPTRPGASRSSEARGHRRPERLGGLPLRPLMEDRPRLIQETNSGHQGREVAERVHQRLREAGGVTPPREFVFMDRAAIGLGSVFMHLNAEVNWYGLFMELIGDFDVQQLRQRQTEALERYWLPLPT